MTAEGDKSPGVLLASGYIAGGALAGIVIAIMASRYVDLSARIQNWSAANNPFFGGTNADLLALLPFVVLCALLYLVGRDVLLESEPDLLQPLSLNIGACRIVVAATQNPPANQLGILRVATKYPRTAARHFGSRGVAVELIQLSGSVELASVLGLADCIVDLVETGNTLRENGLMIIEVITDSTARLVVNRASYQLKADAVGQLVQSLEQTMEASVE